MSEKSAQKYENQEADQEMVEVDLDQVATIVNNKESMREILARNQYLVPKASEDISLKFLVRVFKREAWLPQKEEVKWAICYNPPPKKDIVAQLQKELSIRISQQTGLREAEAFRATH